MRYELSSHSTKFWKEYFPIVGGSFMAIGALPAMFSLGGEIMIALFVAGCWIMLYWLSQSVFRLKRVAMDDGYLYISDFRKEIRLPLSSIASVKENSLTYLKVVTITLQEPSEFGSKILFAPEWRLFDDLTSHPVVGELREAIRRNAVS
jgi:hypothetical protein